MCILDLKCISDVFYDLYTLAKMQADPRHNGKNVELDRPHSLRTIQSRSTVLISYKSWKVQVLNLSMNRIIHCYC